MLKKIISILLIISLLGALCSFTAFAEEDSTYTTSSWQSASYASGTGLNDSKQFVSNIQTLPQDMTISKLVLNHDSSKIMSFSISVSADNQTYTPICGVYPGGTDKYSGRQVLRFAPQTVRYIKYSAVLLGTEETQASVSSMTVSNPATKGLKFENIPAEINPIDTDEVELHTLITDSEGESYIANKEAVTYEIKSAPVGVELIGNTLHIAKDAGAGLVTICATDATGYIREEKIRVVRRAAVHNLSMYTDNTCTATVSDIIPGSTVYAGAKAYADALSKDKKYTIWAASYEMINADGAELEALVDIKTQDIEISDDRKGGIVGMSYTIPATLTDKGRVAIGIYDADMKALTKGEASVSKNSNTGVSVQNLYLGINDSFPVLVTGADGITYESTNTAVATVDSTGMVRSVGEGYGTILAKADGTVVAQIPVHVKAGMYVYLLMGQSNATGTNYSTYMPDVDVSISDGVYILNGSDEFEVAQHRYTRYSKVTNGAGHSSALSIVTPTGGISMSYEFGERFVADHRLTDYGVIGNTLSGCRLEVFEKNSVDAGANGFVSSVARAKAATEGKDAILKGIMWHQGESNGPSAQYTWSLRNMIYDFRVALGDMELPFMAGYLSVDRSYLPEAEQEAAAESARTFNSNLTSLEDTLANFGAVDSEGLKLRITEEPVSANPADGFVQDKSHFSARSQIIFGSRYYDKYLEIK